MDGDRRATLLGFGVAVTLLAALLWLVGIGEFLDTIADTDLAVFAGVPLVALLWLAWWGLALRTVLGTLGVEISAPRALLVLAGAQFANNVTPFGQAGGEPFSALLISRTADAEYETGLAAIASVDALNFFPPIAAMLVGVSYYAIALTLSRRVLQAALAMTGFTALLVGTAVLAWWYRDRLERVATGVLSPIARAIAAVLPGRSPPSSEAIRERVDGFFADIDRVAASPQRVALAVAFSAAGWVCLAASLWLSLRALGHVVPFPAVLIAVPLGAMAGVTPLPGGLGGVEAVLVAVLIPVAFVSPPVASAAVFLHRVGTFWIPIAVGGGYAAVVGAIDR